MKKNMKKAVLACGASVVLIWCVNGCKSKEAPTTQPAKMACCPATQPSAKKPDGTKFYAAGEKSVAQRLFEIQAASGARADATFNAIHFDGGKLNTLGQAKIDDMLADDDTAEPVVFYLNFPGDDALRSSKQDSILAYVKAKGMSDSQVRFVQGSNPATHHPAAEDLARMKKTESGGAEADQEGASADITADDTK